MSSSLRVKLPFATSLVARSASTHVIGIENHLPWRLGTDLRRFRRRTEGHVIVMGRRTFESIGRPLPNRINIVLSRSPIRAEGIEWARSREDALFIADTKTIRLQKPEFFVIGGENIYKLFAPFIDKVFLTEVFDGGIGGDAKFDIEFSDAEWSLWRGDKFPASEVDEFPFEMKCFLRKKSVQRLELKHRFLQTRPELAGHIEPYVVHDHESAPSRQLNFYESSFERAIMPSI